MTTGFPFAFAVYGNDRVVLAIQPTLPELVKLLDESGVYAGDFDIYPIFRSTRGVEQPIPQGVYSRQSDDGRKWEDDDVIRFRISSHYSPFTKDVL